MSRRVFLAHATEDKPRVRELPADLKARGLEPWLDAIDLLPGQIWRDEIPKAIREAGVFLACLSSHSVTKAGYIQTELWTAMTEFGDRPEGTIYFIPARLDDCEIPDLEIPNRGRRLKDVHWVDLWTEGAFDRLVRAIELALGDTEPRTERTQDLPTIVPPVQKPRSDADLKPLQVFRDIDEPWCPEMVVIPAGRFLMGGGKRDLFGSQDILLKYGPQHEVAFERPFALGRYPITFDDYDYFCSTTGRLKLFSEILDDKGWGRGRRPVTFITKDESKSYIDWLSKMTNRQYRLPSEAEWEYACRAGTETPFWTGEEIQSDEANYDGRMYRKQTTLVDKFAPNPWGLFDMHGNVREMCEDNFHDTYEGAPADGSAWLRGGIRAWVIRGGSWYDLQRELRSAARDYHDGFRDDRVGFRLARTLDVPPLKP